MHNGCDSAFGQCLVQSQAEASHVARHLWMPKVDLKAVLFIVLNQLEEPESLASFWPFLANIESRQRAPK